MSITLGVEQCQSAKKVRVFSDTGSWKKTKLRVALFSEVDAEYRFVSANHPHAIITATRIPRAIRSANILSGNFWESRAKGRFAQVGTGGIGAGVLFELEGNGTWWRENPDRLP